MVQSSRYSQKSKTLLHDDKKEKSPVTLSGVEAWALSLPRLSADRQVLLKKKQNTVKIINNLNSKIMSFIESGHAKNTANFDHLLTLLQSYGTSYTPSNPAIVLANLQTVLANAQGALANVKTEYNTWKNATNAREITFEPLKGLSTRLLNTLKAVGVPEQTIKDFKTLNAKIQGSKLTKADAGIAEAPVEDNTAKTALPMSLPAKHPVSASQQSFDSLIEHYDKIIRLLASVPAYNPTETALKVATLQTMLANLKTLNAAAYTCYAKVSNARIARNKILYENPDALILLAKAVKAYVKGKFGATGAEYGQVSAIKFAKVVKK